MDGTDDQERCSAVLKYEHLFKGEVQRCVWLFGSFFFSKPQVALPAVAPQCAQCT